MTCKTAKRHSRSYAVSRKHHHAVLSSRGGGATRGLGMSLLSPGLPRFVSPANQGTLCRGKAGSKKSNAVFAPQAETELSGLCGKLRPAGAPDRIWSGQAKPVRSKVLPRKTLVRAVARGPAGAVARRRQPGGHVISRPLRTWKCRWNTLCPACSPMLETTR